ncbi:NAD(P)-dependent oxidoreductase [Thermomonospora umbrina]|uniref:3-hydroxyisobutyrate dehydrogenase-like beta-hydroxyacid dehydrogenase n=1 Tax=Thermomonospora umbrina TaxID=111806 RepID=A0A3D9SYP6_9ACTN|nr:NAD(P)-binding domain-containing protein [Thermomonospora umbrina]REE97694.1 3-hydroxyisobutyrate dehydrogenase-like beta-hydroxyacid dehydrogenase [Thermomonospora umbrina]
MHDGVTVIGLGAMGSKMVEVFLEAGRPVTVWNRTAAKADPLAAKGATKAASAAEALAANELVVISQVDYAAMYASFAGAESELKGKVLVNLGSGAPDELREAARWAEGHGAALVTAGIMVPPPGIGTPISYAFYSGPEALVDAHRETLTLLGDVRFVGADPGLSMLFYQAMLYVFSSTLAAYFQAAALVGTAGVPAEGLRPYVADMLEQLAGDGPMGIVAESTREIDAGEYPGGENSLHMMAVGMAHQVHAFADAGLDAGVPAALRDLFDRTVAAGFGEQGLTSIVEIIRKPGNDR